VTAALSERGLAELGAELARRLPGGSVVWLEGELGAGKTTLARALAAGRGVRQDATSPTFSLVHRYETDAGPVFHVDCYRLRDPDEASELDWGTMLEGNLLLIEWPERAGPWAPPPALRIRLDYAQGGEARTVTLLGEVREPAA
jgi:tRNA threonylcarbamoyl adenosine modification protein YjeE